MSQTTNLTAAFTQIGTDMAAAAAQRGNVGALTTTATDLAAAINEVAAAVAGSSGINDAATNTTETWSSSKIAAEIVALIDDAAASGTAKTWSVDKIVAEITARVGVQIDAVVGGAPGTLDTLNEIAAALNDNPSVVTDLLAAQALRVRVDAAQAFTGPQQTQGRSNIGAAAASDLTTLTTDVGDTTRDFLLDYTTARDA